MDGLHIGDRCVGPASPTYVVAEAGINHDGELSRAKELIDAAAGARADAVKFQTFRADELYLDADESTHDAFKRLEMPREWITELTAYAEEREVTFLSTPFDRESADILSEHVPAFKIASGTLSDHGLLRNIASRGKPILCSTGIHTQNEISEAVTVLEEAGAEFVLLHCVSAYPTPLDAINVRMVESLRKWFDVQTGLSDHTEHPTVAPTAAVALGATVVEKHLTTDSSREGADHAMALEPNELKRMVTAIRRTETALGVPYEGIKTAERGAYENARRGVFALVDVETGEELTAEKIGVRRANGRDRGLEPARYEDVLGQRASHAIDRFEPVTENHVS